MRKFPQKPYFQPKNPQNQTKNISPSPRTRRATRRRPAAGSCWTVSIHARTRRATNKPMQQSFAVAVSIHARTRRATQKIVPTSVLKKSFNPRPHTAGDRIQQSMTLMSSQFQSTPAHGGRPCPVLVIVCYLGVSIHARTRRATGSGVVPVSVTAVFQSTPAHGGRHLHLTVFVKQILFQSTPAHGGRPKDHVGAVICKVVSIHARTRRATRFT